MKQNKGFTLIELLIVAAIILIVGSIIVTIVQKKSSNYEKEAYDFASNVLNINDPKVSCVTKEDSFGDQYCTVSGFDKTNTSVKTTETLDCRSNGCSVQR